MDTKGKIAVAIAMIVMIGCMYYDAKHQPPPPPPGKPAAKSAVSATPASATQTAAAPVAEPVAPAAPELELPEQTQQIKTAAIDFTFTNHGGGIQSAELTKHKLDPDSQRKEVVLNEYGPVPIGAISSQPGEDAAVSYSGTAAGSVITYQRTTSQQIEITKKFTLPTASEGKDQYVATLDVTFTNRGDKPYRNGGYYVYVGSAAPLHDKDLARYISLDWYRNGKATQVNVMWFSAGKIPLLGIQTSPEKSEYVVESPDISWEGVSSQYFTSIVTPVGVKADRVWATRFPLDISTRQTGADWTRSHPDTTPTWYAIQGALGMPGFSLEPKAAVSQQFTVYLGPRQYQLLKQFDGGQGEVLHMGMSGSISRFLLNAMNLLVSKTGCSYAVAIIVLTITIKLLLWPLQNTATQSMKKMQALTPKMNEVREKYKDDPAKLNQETMKLYKANGVNPLAGCLPMVIQLPIFIGFYSMLGSAIELRNSQFFWVHDLSQPDTVAHLLGQPINVLPLCMAATNVWMMMLTPKSGDSTQQKMMMFTPLMLLFFCYNYASGLALYLMISNLFSVMQLYLTRNRNPPVIQKAAIAGKKKR